MPENGQTQLSQPSIITTPISKLQTNTSPPKTGKLPDKLETFNGEFPEPENIDEYYVAKNEPYGFEYFGLSKELKDMPTYKEWAMGIDDFVKGEIESLDLENSLKTYDHVLKEIIKSLGLHPDTSGLVKLEKLYHWINEVLRPQRTLQMRGKEILDGNRSTTT